DDVLYVVHAGDSRLYIMRASTLHQLTTDHTLVSEMVRNKVLDPAQAPTHPLRNIVTNAVGGDRQGVQPEGHKVEVVAYDAVVVCSDGVTEMVADEEIARVLREEGDPSVCCRRLIERANEEGGYDNVTVVVARFVP